MSCTQCLKCTERTCYYCNAPLSNRHEHDHFPIAKRHGGTNVVSACINCHDLKDRVLLGDDMGEGSLTYEVLRQWSDCPPPVRIFFAKTLTVLADLDELFGLPGEDGAVAS